VGTGTGRMLELFGPRIRHGEGIDLSREMLSVARANLQHAELPNCSVRQADIFQIPFSESSYDAVTIHQVLHFLDRPGLAVGEAVRVLRPGGLILLVDFAPHELESLRVEHEHRRLGFDDSEVKAWFQSNGATLLETKKLKGDPLTVALWLGKKQDTLANSITTDGNS